MVLTAIGEKAAGVVIRAREDFFYFCVEVLGYHREVGTDMCDLLGVHKELCDFMEDEWGNKMVLMPRYSFKSGICTVAYSLWMMVRDPNIRILIYSDNSTKAQVFLSVIKSHIEGKAINSKFRYYFPRWETSPKLGKWNDSQMIISRREKERDAPTVDTGGIDSSKVGYHYDLIIFDDIVSDVNVTTRMLMDKTHECYRKALSLLKPKGGKVVMVGTRWHYGDAYGRIIGENEVKKNFKLFIKDAEMLDETGGLMYAKIGLNREFLDYQRKEQGSYVFSCLYRNSPMSDDTAIFKESDIQFYDPHKNFANDLFITCGLDPAGEGEDFTAITIVGADYTNSWYVLDAVNKHLKPSQILDEIVRLNFKWKFNRFACEKNYFKGTLERDFKERVQELEGNAEWHPFSFSENIYANSAHRTFNKVLGLQNKVENKQLFLPGTGLTGMEKVYRELVYQMTSFTVDGSKSPHDDLLVSLSFHMLISRTGGRPTEKGAPEGSAVWIEQQWYDGLMSNRRLPRRYRDGLQLSLS